MNFNNWFVEKQRQKMAEIGTIFLSFLRFVVFLFFRHNLLWFSYCFASICIPYWLKRNFFWIHMTGVQALRLCAPFNMVTFHLEKHFLSSDYASMYTSFVEYVWTYVTSAPWSCIFSCTFYSTIETADPDTKKIFEWVCGAPRCIETETTRINLVTSLLLLFSLHLCWLRDCLRP